MTDAATACPEGNEAPLVSTSDPSARGRSYRALRVPIAISETVYLDRERCILCDRCTRFASDVAGDPLIHFIDRGANTEVATFPNEPFSSYFSGNTVQICPVGALTAKPYRFRARPWDLDEVESTCTGCSVGCRITVQSSRNRVLRYQGVDSDPVNWSWLCDKGRFGFEAVNVKPDEDIAASIATAREHGLDSLTVTADARWIRAALDAGVDIILTDDLELLAELQEEACAR